jgi:hypothetical protein
MSDSNIRLMDKIRMKANASDGAISAAYLSGLRDAEELLRDLDAMDAPLAEKKFELRQQFLRIMKTGQENIAAQAGKN